MRAREGPSHDGCGGKKRYNIYIHIYIYIYLYISCLHTYIYIYILVDATPLIAGDGIDG
jgi:hypothetical protein